MAQLIVRRLEDTIAEKLRRRARRHGRSMEDEIRDILRNAAKDDERPVRALGSRIAGRFSRVGLTAELPELRGDRARPADVKK